MGIIEIFTLIATVGGELFMSLYKRWEKGNEQEKEAALAEARAALEAAKAERSATEEAHKKLWGTEPAKTVTFDLTKVLDPKGSNS